MANNNVDITISANANAAQGAINQLRESMSGLAKAAGIGFGAFAAKEAIESLVRAGIEAEKLHNQLKFVAGSAFGAANELEYLRKTTDQIGVDFKSASAAYAKLAASAKDTALEGQQTRDIFESISKAAVVMGLSAEETNGALLAISQMMSKGTVSSEELRGQLGERLPGAFNVAATAMGVTTAELGKMLEQGEVISSTFLPKFAQALNDSLGDNPQSAASSAQAQINRLTSSWDQFKVSLAESGVLTAVTEGVKALAGAVNYFNNSKANQLARAEADLAAMVAERNSSKLYRPLEEGRIKDKQKEIREIQAAILAEQKAVEDASIAKKAQAEAAAEAEKLRRRTSLSNSADEITELLNINQQRTKIDNDAADAYLKNTNRLSEASKRSKAIAEENNAYARVLAANPGASQARLEEFERAHKNALANIDKDANKKREQQEKESNDTRIDLLHLFHQTATGEINAFDEARQKSATIAATWANAEKDALEQIAFEASLIGKTTQEIERMTAARKIDRDLQKTLFDAAGKPLTDANTARDLTARAGELKPVINTALLQKQAAEMDKALADPMQAFSASLRETFATAGDGFARMIDSIGALQNAQKAYSDQLKTIDALRATGSEGAEKAAAMEIRLSGELSAKQIGAYASMAGAAKGFFKENSRGYAALQAAEKTFRVFELGIAISNAVKKIALNGEVAASAIAGNAAATESAAAANAASLTQTAVLAAGIAGLAYAVAGFGKGSRNLAAERQAKLGTGSVFGDASAVSKSIKESIDRLADVDTLTMRYSAQMAASLRVIENNIAGVGNAIAISSGFTTGAFAISQGLGVYDAGLLFARATLAELAKGREVSQFAEGFISEQDGENVNTFGGQVRTQALDPVVSQQIGKVFTQLQNSLQAAAVSLGKDGDAFAQKLAGFTLDIGDGGFASLKGLQGEALTEALDALFNKTFDQVSKSLLPGFERFAKIGEGSYETTLRVASGIDAARAIAEKYRFTLADLSADFDHQGDVTTELVRASLLAANQTDYLRQSITQFNGSAEELAQTTRNLTTLQRTLQGIGLGGLSDNLLQAVGGLDALEKASSRYQDAFLTPAEQLQIQANQLQADFRAIGQTAPQSRAAFRSLLESTTDDRLRGQLLALADAFADFSQSAEDAKNGLLNSAKGLRDAIAQQSLKGLSPTETLQTLQTRFVAAQVAAETATGTDLQARAGELQALIDPLLSAGRDYYASGPGFQALKLDVLSVADALAVRLESGGEFDPTINALDNLRNETVTELVTSNQNTAAMVVQLGEGFTRMISRLDGLQSEFARLARSAERAAG